MNYIFSSLLLTISFLSTNLSFVDKNIPNDCKTAIEEAKRDHTNNQLKYYTFGIASFPKQKVKINIDPKLKINIDPEIEVISLGCMINAHQICYNQYVDSLLVVKTGKDFYGLRK